MTDIMDAADERFGLEELLDGPDAPGALVARALVCSGRAILVESGSLDGALAGTEPTRHLLRCLNDAALDVSAEPVGGFVGDLHRFIDRVVQDDRDDRPKDLLSRPRRRW